MGLEEDKRVGGDDDEEEEDDDWGKRNDGCVSDLDGGVEKEKDNDKASDEDHSGSGHLGTSGEAPPLDTRRKPPSLDIPKKLVDTTEDAVVISDGGKVSRLIATLALILIAIVIDTIARAGTSASGNPTPRHNPAIPSVIKLSATGSNAADRKKLLDITDDVVVFLDRGKVFRLIATLALIPIAIVVDTNARSRISMFGNLTPRNNPIIPSVVKPFAAGNDTSDLFANILGNPFDNLGQDASPVDSAARSADFFAPFLVVFFALSQE